MELQLYRLYGTSTSTVEPQLYRLYGTSTSTVEPQLYRPYVTSTQACIQGVAEGAGAPPWMLTVTTSYSNSLVKNNRSHLAANTNLAGF